MVVRNIDLLKVWDDEHIIEKNIDFLRIPTKPVQKSDFKSPQIKQIIEDLIDTYQAIPCAGIAANQIGYDEKLFIGMKHNRNKTVSDDSTQNIDKIEPKPDNYEIYINPRIDKTNEKSTQQGSEGCLSIPGISLIIERYDEIDIRYYNIDGKKQKKSLAGFLSRLFQHELDHLNGKLMFEDPISNILLDNSVTLESKYIYQIQKLIKYTIGK